MTLVKNASLVYIPSIDGEVIIYNEKNKTIHSLDKLGISILKITKEKIKFDDLVENLKIQYPLLDFRDELKPYINLLIAKEILQIVE